MITGQKLYIDAVANALKERVLCADELCNLSVDLFYKSLINDGDQQLLDVAFNKDLSQEQLDVFLAEWDIECQSSDRVLLLSYVMKLHPNLTFNDYVGPRLKGLLNFFRFNNLTVISYYTKIGKELNKHSIIPLIMKGGAMKFLRPELSRVMGDIDILVFDTDYQCSKQIVMDMGYVFEDNKHSFDIHLPDGSKDGFCDIHQYIELEQKYDKNLLKVLKARAQQKTIFGVETYLPCVEDLFFICLVNMVKNIRNGTSVKGIIYTLFDLDYLKNVKQDFNWNIIKSNIKLLHAYPQMMVAVKFANKIVPGIVPNFLFDDNVAKRSVTNYFNRDIFYTKYVNDIRRISGEIKIGNIHRLNDLVAYLKIKFTKQVRFFILHRPWLIAIYLKLHKNK